MIKIRCTLCKELLKRDDISDSSIYCESCHQDVPLNEYLPMFLTIYNCIKNIGDDIGRSINNNYTDSFVFYNNVIEFKMEDRERDPYYESLPIECLLQDPKKSKAELIRQKKIEDLKLQYKYNLDTVKRLETNYENPPIFELEKACTSNEEIEAAKVVARARIRVNLVYNQNRLNESIAALKELGVEI